MGRETGEAEAFEELPRTAPEAAGSSRWAAFRAETVNETGAQGYPAEVLELLGRVRHHFAYAELATSAHEIMGHTGAPGEPELKIFRAMIEDVTEEGEGDLQRGLLIAWERRTGDRVSWPQPVAELWASLTDDRARARLEHKTERICRDLDNPTPYELGILGRMVAGLVRRGEGDATRGLLAEWELERADARPWGQDADHLPRCRARIDEMVEAFRAGHPGVSGAERLEKRTTQEMKHALRAMEMGDNEATRERVTGLTRNLQGIWAEWETAVERAARGPLEIGRRFEYADERGNERVVDVDVLAESGQLWVEVKDRNPFSVDSAAWQDLRNQAGRLRAAAAQNVVGGVAPRVAVEFRRGVTPSVADALTELGVEVVNRQVERTWEL